MKTLKRIYISIFALLSVSVMLIPAFIPGVSNEGLILSICAGGLGVYAVIHFLKFNQL